VELVRAGRTPESLAKEFEPSAVTIRKWVAQAAIDDGQRADGLTTEEKQELQRLRREVRVLREEKEILRKAAANSTGQGNSRWKTEAGERNPSVLRGRAFRRRAMPFRSACENPSRGVPLGKYCLRRRLVFSFVPRCQGL
jgi:transposase